MFDLLYATNSQPQVNPLASFLPLILIFLVFYFLLVIPQQRRQKKHQEMINSLKRGDKVVTTGGIHGVISDIKETTFILKIDENTKIEIEKSSIAYKKQS
ncbi:MAG: preprotein translocase subunit YajC [candidate division WOR-3 bacterium]|nr:preprotein translocase subunit YajC [candidate division WOR-3 bacterium]MDW8113514.1 preprotein translocase subunit YajC [candidate division WOR-3 bacterium]